MWRKWAVQFGLWLACHGGWSKGSITAPYEEQIRRLSVDAERLSIGFSNEIRDLQARMATSATVSPPVFARAGELTRDADTTLSGGEAKRHAVYARLIKDFPAVNKRELALAIELALFHVSKEG